MKPLLKQYFSSQGKISRSQYWLRTLAFLIGSTLLIVLFKKTSLGGWEGLLGIVWSGAWIRALFVVGIRRCRDVGINLHWLWLWLFPGLGNIFYIVLGCLKPDDGVRIARPTPKEGLVRYFSVFGYATRQEYWCITLPITTATYGVSSTAILLFASLASFFNGVNILFIFFVIFVFTSIAAYLIVPAWLIAATIVRRCRDATLDLRWAIVYLIPSWLYQIVFILSLARTPKSLLWKLENPMQLLMLNSEIDNKLWILSFLLLVPYIVFGILTSKEKT